MLPVLLLLACHLGPSAPAPRVDEAPVEAERTAMMRHLVEQDLDGWMATEVAYARRQQVEGRSSDIGYDVALNLFINQPALQKPWVARCKGRMVPGLPPAEEASLQKVVVAAHQAAWTEAEEAGEDGSAARREMAWRSLRWLDLAREAGLPVEKAERVCMIAHGTPDPCHAQ